MARIRVVTDSACDLSAEVAAAHGVTIVPLTIRFGDEEFVDREELSGKEFWARVQSSPTMPETAAPSPGAFQTAFEDAARQGAESVVCVNLSSGLSATYQSARAAADAVAADIPVTVIDSQSVTVGQGLMVLTASDLAADGATPERIRAEVEDLRSRTHVYGAVGTLDFLKRGGRIGGAAHLVGSLLSIQPVIEVRGGVVELESKQRTRTRVLQYLASKALNAGPLDRLAVANGAADDADVLVGQLAAAETRHDLILTELGPVVGAHAGPGTVGVCFQIRR